jgi:PilZ domain
MISWRKIKAMFVSSDAKPAAKKKDAEQDKRLGMRKPQRLVQGYIWSERMAFSKACSIRNISVSGARIELRDGTLKAHKRSDVLILYVPADKREIDCHVAWRAGRSMGLRFIGNYRGPTRRYSG